MKLRICIVLFSLLWLVACGDGAPSPTVAPTAVVEAPVGVDHTPEVSAVAVETAAPTPIPPTPTPTEPLAALVNGVPIFLAAYEKELARYEQAQAELGLNNQETDYRQLVLDALIERELIAQAAQAAGLVVTPAMVEAKLAELREAAGETGNFEAWLEVNQWTEEEFRQILAMDMLTEQMVARVTADVPYAGEQVRARYLQVDDGALANALLEQLRAGADFDFLAAQHSLDRITAPDGGDLGYFARGSLLVPAVEEAAFSLAPGQISEVITETLANGESTYYIVQTMERDPQRPLSADLRYNLLQQAFEAWLETQWQQADVVRFIDTS